MLFVILLATLTVPKILSTKVYLLIELTGLLFSVIFILQDAQLSQRDRAAGCVIVFAKSRRLKLGDNILQTL